MAASREQSELAKQDSSQTRYSPLSPILPDGFRSIGDDRRYSPITLQNTGESRGSDAKNESALKDEGRHGRDGEVGDEKDLKVNKQFDFKDIQTPAKIEHKEKREADKSNNGNFSIPGMAIRHVESTDKKLILVKEVESRKLEPSDESYIQQTPKGNYYVNPQFKDSFFEVNHGTPKPESFETDPDKLSPTFGHNQTFSNSKESPHPQSPNLSSVRDPNFTSLDYSPFIPSPRHLGPFSSTIGQSKPQAHLPRDKARLYKWIEDKERERDMMFRKMVELDSELQTAKQRLIGGKSNEKRSIKLIERQPVQIDLSQEVGTQEKPWLRYKTDKRGSPIKARPAMYKEEDLQKFVNPSLRESRENHYGSDIENDRTSPIDKAKEEELQSPVLSSNEISQVKGNGNYMDTEGYLMINGN